MIFLLNIKVENFLTVSLPALKHKNYKNILLSLLSPFRSDDREEFAAEQKENSDGMHLLNLLYKPLDFSDEKLGRLAQSIERLRCTLVSAGFACYAEQLARIGDTLERKDSHSFREQVNCRVLFGGFGAMWEIWISDKMLMSQFERQFRAFLDNLEEVGIRNEKIQQIRKVFAA